METQKEALLLSVSLYQVKKPDSLTGDGLKCANMNPTAFLEKTIRAANTKPSILDLHFKLIVLPYQQRQPIGDRVEWVLQEKQWDS